jgi:hypothetical protein
MSVAGPKKPIARDGVALALARGCTRKAAAKSVGINERTVRRWLEDPEFVQEVTGLRDRMFAAATGRLAGLTARAAAKLGALLEAVDCKVQLRAAVAILTTAATYRDQLDLAARLAEVERRLAEQAVAEGRADR